MTGYSELVKALTCGNDGKLPCHNNECPYWVDQWHGIGLCNVIKKDADAADAIEAMQAQLPKRGEWELIDGVEPMRWGCSRCKYMSWETSNYCPRCGAKMEVQE